MTTTPTDTSSGDTDSGSASDAPTSEVHLHPRYAADLQQTTEDLTTAYREMKSTALDLIDQQIQQLSDGKHDLPKALSTLVIATLAETRVSLLAIDPATSEAAQELTDIVTKLRALVQQPAS